MIACMSRRLLVLWASLIACTPITEPVGEPVVASLPSSEATQPEGISPEVIAPPPLDDVLFEIRSATTGPAMVTMEGATFPELTLYTDGTLLRAVPIEPGGSARELRMGRLAPEQLDRVLELIAALAPLDQVERTEQVCHLDPFTPTIHVLTHFRVRSGDHDWECVRGCPVAPAEFSATFVELVDHLGALEITETRWQPTHGHFAVSVLRDPRGTLPWSSTDWDLDFPHAWLLDAASFPEVWELAGGHVGAVTIKQDGAEFMLSVVPWRPGEDLSETVGSFNRGRYESPACPWAQALPRRRP